MNRRSLIVAMSLINTQMFGQGIKEVYFDNPDYSFWFSQKQQDARDEQNHRDGRPLQRNRCSSGPYTEANLGDKPIGFWDDYRLVQPRKVLKARAE